MQAIKYFNTNEDENRIDTTKQEIGDELIKEIIQFIRDKGFTVNFDYGEDDLDNFSVLKDNKHLFAVEIY